MIRALLPCLLLIAACGGVAFDTRVAQELPTRLAMLGSITPGDSTMTQVETRWGNPLQKVREGGREEWIYRSRTGPQDNFVIVTFEYGVAIAARSNETESCRASFAPRVPGYGWDTPDIVKPTGWCANPDDPYVNNGMWIRIGEQIGALVDEAEQTLSTPPGVTPDRYEPQPGSAK